jgi:hypothetical protein
MTFNNSQMTNILGEAFAMVHGSNFLDSNNILWKIVDNNWIGKRSVYTFDLTTKWLEDTKLEYVKSWWCGIDSDYNEIFTR